MLRAWIPLLLACGSAPAASTAASVPNDEWASRDFSARHSTMTFTVQPTMALRFAEHQGTTYPALTCRSCHGENAEEVRYAMPNGLPALDPDAMPDTDEARWMAEVVVPLADRLMRAGGTTTCFSCHPRDGS